MLSAIFLSLFCTAGNMLGVVGMSELDAFECVSFLSSFWTVSIYVYVDHHACRCLSNSILSYAGIGNNINLNWFYFRCCFPRFACTFFFSYFIWGFWKSSLNIFISNHERSLGLCYGVYILVLVIMSVLFGKLEASRPCSHIFMLAVLQHLLLPCSCDNC